MGLVPQKAWDAYFAVWAQQGMDDPQVYFEALVAPVAGFVSLKDVRRSSKTRCGISSTAEPSC